MPLFHVEVSRTMIGFIEVRSESEEEAKQVAEEVIYAGKEDPGIHWIDECTVVLDAERHPEAWTAGMEFLEVKKNGSDESVQGS